MAFKAGILRLGIKEPKCKKTREEMKSMQAVPSDKLVDMSPLYSVSAF